MSWNLPASIPAMVRETKQKASDIISQAEKRAPRLWKRQGCGEGMKVVVSRCQKRGRAGVFAPVEALRQQVAELAVAGASGFSPEVDAKVRRRSPLKRSSRQWLKHALSRGPMPKPFSSWQKRRVQPGRYAATGRDGRPDNIRALIGILGSAQAFGRLVRNLRHRLNEEVVIFIFCLRRMAGLKSCLR